MGTPDLSFAVSSSPYPSPMKRSLSPLPASFDHRGCGNVPPLSKSTSHNAFFIHRLDYLLLEAVEQQCHPGNPGNMRIQRAFSEDFHGPTPQIVSIAVDTSPRPAADLRSVVLTPWFCFCRNLWDALCSRGVLLVMLTMRLPRSLATRIIIQGEINERRYLRPTRRPKQLPGCYS
jgi:hypothetical protein